MLERFVKTYCGKRNHLSLDDFVYCVTKVKNTHGKESPVSLSIDPFSCFLITCNGVAV